MDATFLTKRHNKCLTLVIATILSITVIFSLIICSGSSSYNNIKAIDVLGSTAVLEAPAAGVQEDAPPAAEPPAVNLSDYEASMLHLLNTVRVENGLAALSPNQSLTDISRTRSNDMLARNYFSHYTPEGTNVFNLMRECGIQFSAAGENLGHCTPANVGTPEAFLHAWMNSPGHKANILQSKYGIIGVGMVENGSRRVITTVFRN
jgi:uncharacterized protein YkwD